MSKHDAIEQACQEVMRETVIRYVGFACLVFGLIAVVFALTAGRPYLWFAIPVFASGAVLMSAGIWFLIRPPVNGLQLGSRLFFAAAGMNLVVWMAGIIFSTPFVTGWLVMPMILAFHGWLALQFRTRFGDRTPETTPASLRAELGKVLRSLVHGNPATSSAFIRYIVSDAAAPFRSSFEEWHGWLSPQGYAVFLVFNSPVAFNENLITAASHLRRVCVIDRTDLSFTPTGEIHGRWVKVHIGIASQVFANVSTTAKSMENFQQWKHAGAE